MRGYVEDDETPFCVGCDLYPSSDASGVLDRYLDHDESFRDPFYSDDLLFIASPVVSQALNEGL